MSDRKAHRAALYEYVAAALPDCILVSDPNVDRVRQIGREARAVVNVSWAGTTSERSQELGHHRQDHRTYWQILFVIPSRGGGNEMQDVADDIFKALRDTLTPTTGVYLDSIPNVTALELEEEDFVAQEGQGYLYRAVYSHGWLPH